MEDEVSLKKKSGSELLDARSEEIVNSIIDETDTDKLKNLIAIFNSNQSKKDIVRNNVFSLLLDKISMQMLERFEKNPNAFSNKDLIDYLNAIKSARSSRIDTEAIDAPSIQNNTQINVTMVDGLNRESKERVVDTVQAILKRLGAQSEDFYSEDDG
jgi:hypothetical protein